MLHYDGLPGHSGDGGDGGDDSRVLARGGRGLVAFLVILSSKLESKLKLGEEMASRLGEEQRILECCEMTEREGEVDTVPLGWRLKSEEVSTSSNLETVSAKISLTLLSASYTLLISSVSTLFLEASLFKMLMLFSKSLSFSNF